MAFLIPLLQRLLVWVGTKILLAFGLSFVTYTGITLSLNTLKDYVSNNFNNVPDDVYALLIMAGLGHVIGIIFGAFAFNAAMSATTKLVTGINNKV